MTDPAADPEVEAAQRVIFFSDAVVAIAITLLALALPVPHTTDGTSNIDFLRALHDQWSEYLAFLISFLVIGNHWSGHRRTFRYVARLGGAVGRLNMLWLLMVVLTPFATRILTSDGGFGVRFGIYALIQVIASACLMLLNREFSRLDLLRPDAPEAVRQPDNVRGLVFIVVFLISIPVAFATAWAFVLWAAVSPLSLLVQRRREKRPPRISEVPR
ncbi:MAG TPA: TMEM175 family protein [Mycobacteriales bacterium]|nr:TMEM175 family protein [Mycobacteriales bacterium]